MVASPYIASKDVKAALENLTYTPSERNFAGLQRLLLVELRMIRPSTPGSDRLRDYAVRELLVDQVVAGYSEQRGVFKLLPPDVRAAVDRATADLAADARIAAPDLMAWSVLYYRFVRSDLNLAVEMLAKQFGMSTRNITRYTDAGVELLTARLIQAEEQARADQRQRRLYASLPVSASVTLVGRDAWLNQAFELLPTLSPCHFVVTGAAGIGKTMVVQELIRRLIADDRLDHLVWLDSPRSVRSIRQRLTEELLREDGTVGLREYCLIYRVAVVLDGIEAAAAEREAFDNLLGDLGAALVGLINRTPVSTATAAIHLPVAEIAQADAYDLVRRELPYDESDRWLEVSPYLYEQVGGNPMALKLGAGMIDNLDGLAAAVSGELLRRLFGSLGVNERRVWCALALFPQAARAGDLYALWGFAPEATHTLIRHHLAERDDNQSFILEAAARDFVRQCYATSGEVQAIFDALVAVLQPKTAPFSLLENVLASGIPELAGSIRETWIKALWPEATKSGHWARWREILEAQTIQAGAFDPELRVVYGVCLRRLGDWAGAQQLFADLVRETGAVGDFATQARALIEWATLAQRQGDYQQAAALLGESRRYAERARASELLYALHLQEARLAILAHQGGKAADLLKHLPETPQVLALRSEAQLELRHYPACRSLAGQASALVKDDLSAEASLSTVIGRSYEAQRDYERAKAYFTDAVTLFQRLNDGFALARAQTNLAAVLIRLGQSAQDSIWVYQASDLLAQSEQIQQRLGDMVGLSVTRHNLSVLGGHIRG